MLDLVYFFALKISEKLAAAYCSDEWFYVFSLFILASIHCHCIPAVVFLQKYDLVLSLNIIKKHDDIYFL